MRRPAARNRTGASTAASAGSPPNAGHHGWNAHDVHSAPCLGWKSPVRQAFSTAFHTAVVRVVRNCTDCADGVAVMISPVRRYISRMAAGRWPSTSLAQERVEVHAGEAALLVVARRAGGRSCSR